MLLAVAVEEPRLGAKRGWKDEDAAAGAAEREEGGRDTVEEEVK